MRSLGRSQRSTIVDLFAGYDWRNMSFEVFGTNVFDKRNQLSRFIICGAFCSSTDYLHMCRAVRGPSAFARG